MNGGNKTFLIISKSSPLCSSLPPNCEPDTNGSDGLTVLKPFEEEKWRFLLEGLKSFDFGSGSFLLFPRRIYENDVERYSWDPIITNLILNCILNKNFS